MAATLRLAALNLREGNNVKGKESKESKGKPKIDPKMKRAKKMEKSKSKEKDCY